PTLARWWWSPARRWSRLARRYGSGAAQSLRQKSKRRHDSARRRGLRRCPSSGVSYDNLHPVRTSIQGQAHLAFATLQGSVVEAGLGNAPAALRGSVDADPVVGFLHGEGDVEARPGRGNARVDDQLRCFAADAEDAFEAGAVHPAG